MAISKSWRSLSGEDEQSKMISIYDMKNGEIVQRFGTKSVLDLCFIDEDAVASVEHSSSLSPYYNGWEMQESIYSLKDGKSLWQSQKTRITDTIAVDNPAAFVNILVRLIQIRMEKRQK